jgi:MYXO-CTERM domain-containing protein
MTATSTKTVPIRATRIPTKREHGTDPKNPDTDDDGKPDGEEVKVLGTNPLVADSTTQDDSSGGGGGTTGLPLLLTLLAVLRRRLQR